MNGIEISRRYYLESVAPGLAGVPHAAALLGAGSEVLGYDDDVSPDHDFGERVQVFYPDRETVGDFFTAGLGVDPLAGMSVADWLLTPTQILAGLTRGAVFHDPEGELARRRAALAWYPADVWRYALAAGWLKVGQEEAFVARAGSTGDDLGSRILAGRLVRELMRIAFLVERRWAPYGKWFGKGFGELKLAAELGPPLRGALGAETWREREDMICTAGSLLAAATNELGLCPAVDPAPRRFYTRDIRVLDGHRFTVAMIAEISDPVLLGIVERVGRRNGIPRAAGTIDQAVDSTDVLGDIRRCRAAAPMLGL
ncbi:DUF4037 domain-containing protein [Actinoplanes sp. KI2]|uniref:DUF4037 domain-containing protein n=1 Tax=Actinoplanes sp. KI2 TaxID=2983315 RepID=UPI0021D5CB1D|nr:DUF4037 domain-containing protein [Actinoplanes sp. KI2]MCU7728660.1 DUF4037 domain-containing protein [Actinoplanes sp. KI2]